MEPSILITIKKMLGLDQDYDVFDEEIKVHINSVFMYLNQLGVGPDTPFSITGDTEKWLQFAPDVEDTNALKTYMYLRVKLVFDPPNTSFVLKAIQDQITELEWRLNVQAEPQGDPNV